MTGGPPRAIGGAIVTTRGQIEPSGARMLARFYAGLAGATPEGSFASRFCLARGDAFARAAEEAERWRRAAGWPGEADQA